MLVLGLLAPSGCSLFLRREASVEWSRCFPPPPNHHPGVERKGSWEEGSGRGLFQPLVHLVAIGTPGDR